MDEAFVRLIDGLRATNRAAYALLVVAVLSGTGLALSFLADWAISQLRRAIVRQLR